MQGLGEQIRYTEIHFYLLYSQSSFPQLHIHGLKEPPIIKYYRIYY